MRMDPGGQADPVPLAAHARNSGALNLIGCFDDAEHITQTRRLRARHHVGHIRDKRLVGQMTMRVDH